MVTQKNNAKFVLKTLKKGLTDAFKTSKTKLNNYENNKKTNV